MSLSKVASAVVVLALASGCSKKEETLPLDPQWVAGLEKFHQRREKSIGGDDGWVTLAGRFVLKQGSNTIGSDPSSLATLPADRAPAKAATLVVEATQLNFVAAEGVEWKVEGQPVTRLTLKDDSGGKPTVLELGSLRLHVIRRGNNFMLRVKDREHPLRKAFTGLTWFEPALEWRVKAKLEPSPPGTTVPILNVLNQTENEASPGHLVFTVDGKEHRLLALKEDDPGYFVIFKDQTAGEGTYPSGRFINTAAADAEGFVDLDFNRAYSPPCAFTKFATCPLPPKENHLALKIEAGERYAGAH